MPTYQEIHTRGQQTTAVWSFHAPTYTPGGLTLAALQADVAAMPGADQAVVDAEAVIDEKRDLRNAKLALIRELGTRLPRLAATELPPDDSLQDDIQQLQGINMNDMPSTMDRGQRVRTIWTETNARLAAATPPRPALTVLKPGSGAWTLADLVAALAAIEPLEQAVKDAGAPLGKKRTDRRTLAARVDRTNKRWYEAWSAHFPVGSPEHDALAQVTTEGGGVGGGGSEPPPGPTEPPPAPTEPPAAPEDPELIPGAVDSGELGAQCTVPAGATGLKIWQEGSTPTLLATVTDVTALPHLLTFVSGIPVTLFFTATNAAGESAPSATVTATTP
jgi:hypothetical protein